MDLKLSEQQRLLVDSARGWLASSWSPDVAWPWIDGDSDLPEAAWDALRGLGWTGLAISESGGGEGGDLLDLTLLQEELGQALFPSTFASTMVTARLLDRAPDRTAAQQEILERLAAGSAIGTFAITEEDGAFFNDSPTTRLTPADDGWTLTGEKLFVRDAGGADVIAVLAARPSGDLAWALVERGAPGLVLQRQRSTGSDRQYKVRFDGVPVDQIVESSVDAARADAMLLECAYLTGIGARAHSMTIDYAKQRVQFGRPIGSFQAIQHRVANMTTDLEASRLVTQYVATRLDLGPAYEEAAMAKLWVSEAISRLIRHAHQIHGGIGFITEYPLHRYFRRSRSGELMYGSPFELVERVADVVMDPEQEPALGLDTA